MVTGWSCEEWVESLLAELGCCDEHEVRWSLQKRERERKKEGREARGEGGERERRKEGREGREREKEGREGRVEGEREGRERVGGRKGDQ